MKADYSERARKSLQGLTPGGAVRAKEYDESRSLWQAK